jgi:hypothetical protein
MRLYMFPCFAAHDQANIRYIYAKALRQLWRPDTLRAQITDFADKCVGQLNHTVSLAFRRTIGVLLECGALFRCHINTVIFGGAEKQVIGSHATGVITNMANIQPFWNRAIMQFPGDTMGVKVGLVRATDSPIPMRKFARPFPATGGFVDFPPKADRGRISHVGSSFQAIGHASGCLQQRRGFVLPSL